MLTAYVLVLAIQTCSGCNSGLGAVAIDMPSHEVCVVAATAASEKREVHFAMCLARQASAP